MRKYIACLLVLASLMSMVVVPAAAATARVEYCEYCQKEVEWTAWSGSAKGDSKPGTGHYYLKESFSISGQKIAMGTVCLDLNGNTMESVGRALLASGKQYTTGTPIINVMDSKGGGVVIGKGGTNNAGGGTAVASYGGIINLYSGTLKHETIDGSIATVGGVVCSYGDNTAGQGTFNMYGGCVDAGKCNLAKDTKNLVGGNKDGCGAAIAVYGGSFLNLRGGRVIAGKAEPDAGRGDCVFVHSKSDKVVISKDVQIDDIWFDEDPTNSLTVSGKLTGSVQLTSRVNQGEGVVIGKTTANADISEANVTYAADSYFVDVTEAGLVLTQNPTPNGVAGTAPTGSRIEYCEYCKKEVTWTAWTSAGHKNLQDVTTGHYYLQEDIIGGKYKSAHGTVCLDLNGHTIKSYQRALLISGTAYTGGKPIMNVMDSKGGGFIISEGGTNNVGGGTVTISGGGMLNLYSGTLKYITVAGSTTTYGGVLSVSGKSATYNTTSTFNMYGGCVDASQCVLVDDPKGYITDNRDGCGAAISSNSYGILNFRGGRVIGGKALDGVGCGDCVHVDTKNEPVYIANDAQIDEIWFGSDPAASLTVVGKYTGSFKVNGKTAPNEESVVGKTTANTDISEATITHTLPGYYVVGSENGLVYTKMNPKATAVVIDGDKAISYNELNEAVANADGRLVRLNEDVSDPIFVNADTYLDLNGHSITGKVQIADGATLYGADAATDDYTITDGLYGKLTDVVGNVAGLPQETGMTANPYLMHSENGEISFHCMGLQLTAMTFRGEQGGVYYKSAFGGDEIVARYVKAYGVALSLYGAPTADRLAASCRSRYTDFVAGGMDEDATSTLLKNIFSKERNDELNIQYSEMPIYGRAYMELTDGTMVFGETAQRTFKEQIYQVNEIWYTLNIPQRDSAYTLYENFPAILDGWNLMNISAYQDTEKDGILKILNISNSHGQDAIWQLPSVIKAEMPDQEFIIVEMYQSYALTEHIQAAKADSPVYYYQVNTGGFWETVTREMRLSEGLLSQNWDYIVYNESSRHLGLESKMSQGMVEWFGDYIMEHVGHNPKLIYDMTWASPTDDRFYTDSTRQQATATFKATYTKDYGYDHVNHYNQLVALTKKYILTDDRFHMVLFNATPVQYAGEVLGVPQYEETQTFDLYRDYTHISDYARLIVAYNWYCQMFQPEGLTEVKIDTILWQNRAPWNNRHQKLGNIELTEQHKQVLIESVNHALKYPLSITAE